MQYQQEMVVLLAVADEDRANRQISLKVKSGRSPFDDDGSLLRLRRAG